MHRSRLAPCRPLRSTASAALIRPALAAALLAAGSLAQAAPSLAADCRADQADRAAYQTGDAGPDWAAIARRDAQRQARVRAAVKDRRLRSAEDFRCAALILLHAGDEPALRLAYALAIQGQFLAPDRPTLARLAADAWDRLMMARQQPQWFATQLVAAGPAGTGFQLYPVVPGLMSDTERTRLGGLSEAEVQAELARLNAPQPTSQPSAQAPASGAATPDAAGPSPLAFTAEPALLLDALATDPGLANTLAQLLQEGLPRPVPAEGATPARLIFLPRSPAALRAYFERRVPRIPRFEGSATPTSASVAEIRFETRDGRAHRLVVGIDDDVQAAAVLTVRPSRFFALRAEQAAPDGPVTLTAIERQP